jgi:hypothetical protein
MSPCCACLGCDDLDGISGRGFPAAGLFGGLSGSSAGGRCWRAAPGDAGGDGDQLATDGRVMGSGVEAPARQPTARVRLWQMAARVRHAALAGK